MTSDRRFERDLPDLLAELAPRAMPDYRDDIVRQTAHMRQRPAWTFPERWLPVSVITTPAFAAPPIRWRVVGLVALLLLALAVGLVVVAGSQRHVPAPFGPAANGSVAYDRNGDIFTVDPKTGIAVAVSTGPNTDVSPVYSRDGTRILFFRMPADRPWASELVVADADGSRPVVITKQPHDLTGPEDINPAGATATSSRPMGRRSCSRPWARPAKESYGSRRPTEAASGSSRSAWAWATQGSCHPWGRRSSSDP
jgi:hypothetical protein